MAEDMTELTETVHRAWLMLNEPTDADWTTGSLDEMTEVLSRITEIRAFLDLVIRDMMNEIAAKMEADEVVTASGMISRRPRFSSTWIDDASRERLHEDTLRAIIHRVAMDPGTGEVNPLISKAVQETWRLVTDAFSLGADPKAAFRKALGLSPNDYRAKRQSGFVVSLPEERY